MSWLQCTDQLGTRFTLAAPPRRVVSLVPSQTELLFALGVGDRVAGVTRYCTRPADALAGRARVGGTKKFDFRAIEALDPDLVIGNKEENYQDGIERLRQRYPVWMSDIYDLDDALEMIAQVSRMVDAAESGDQLIARIQERFAALRAAASLRAAYLIWRKPYMAVGGRNFIDHLLGRAGLTNVFGGRERYPEVSADELREARPDVVLLSSEPFPFTEDHRAEFETLLPGVRALLVDGTLCSWYGSRLLETPAYLEDLGRRAARSMQQGAA